MAPLKESKTEIEMELEDRPHRLFIGRTKEISSFVQRFLIPKTPAHRIIAISGQAGVGKSALLDRFLEKIDEFNSYCLAAQVDEGQVTPASIMEKFAQQLAEKGHPIAKFTKELSRYNESLRKLRAEHEISRGSFFQKIGSNLVGSAVKELPVVGGFLEKATGPIIEYFLDERRYRQALADAQRLEDRIGNLTKVFIDELKRLTNTQVTLEANGAKRRLRVFLFFDTFEQLAAEVVPWLLDYVLTSSLSDQVVLVIAGRDPIERYPSADTRRNDTKRWLRYRDNQTLYPFKLSSLSEDETYQYLTESGVVSSKQFSIIWQRSGGLPYYLSLVANNPDGDIDPTAEVVENSLKGIPQEDQLKRQLALDASLFTKPFNQDDLAAFSYIDDSNRATFYRWLIRQPFVVSSDGRYRYHHLAQEQFSRYLYHYSPQACHSARKALVVYYEKQLESIKQTGGKEYHDAKQWQELMIGLVYQLFYLPDEGSHLKAIEQLLHAYRHIQQRGELVKALRELSQDSILDNLISPKARQDANQLLKFIQARRASAEELEAATYLIKRVSSAPNFSTTTLGYLYLQRGMCYLQAKQPEQAIKDFDDLINLDPAKFALMCGIRGSIHLTLNHYQEAVDDFSRYIAVMPETAGVYINRGKAYLSLRLYQEAIDDFNRAINLKFDDTAQVYYYRGVANLWTKRYKEAIDDLSLSIKLNGSFAGSFRSRGLAYFFIEHYQQAIFDFDHAIKLWPNEANIYYLRGVTFHNLNNDKRAVADLDRSIKLNPNDAEVYKARGQVYLSLKDYHRATANFDQAASLEPTDAEAYSYRARTFFELGKYEQTIVELNQAIGLNSNVASYYNGRCRAYLALNQFRQALEDNDHFLTLEPNSAEAYTQRGNIYRAQGAYEDALASFNHAIALDATLASGQATIRGLTFSYLGQYFHAIECYKVVLKDSPNHYIPLYNIAVALACWKGLAQAQLEIEAARKALLTALDTSDNRSSALYGLGGLNALEGQLEQALDCLEQSISLEKEVVDWARHDIAWRDLRTDPRFQSLVPPLPQENL